MYPDQQPYQTPQPAPVVSPPLAPQGPRRIWAALRDTIWPSSAGRGYKITVVAICTTVVLLAGLVTWLSLTASKDKKTTDTTQQTPDNQTQTPGDTTKPGTTTPATTEPTTTTKPGTTTTPGATNKTPTKTGTSGGSTPTGGGTTGGGGTSGGGGGSTGVCPAFPAFPDADCTGYVHTGVTLHNCDGVLTTDNAVYDSCRFVGGIVIMAANVTIKRSKIEGRVSPLTYGPYEGSLRGLTLTDVEIDASSENDPYGQAAIGIDNYTCIRCNVHHSGRGANFRFNVRIEESYFHDFIYVSGAHQSGIGSNGGNGSSIIHNNIQCNGVGGSGCSGALVIYGDFDPVDNVLVENNLFNTDGSYCTYAGSTGTASGKPYPHGTNIRYLNNRFGKKYYNSCGANGPAAAWEANAGNVWSGNTWLDGSGTVTPVL